MDSKEPFYKSIPFWIVVLLLLYSALGFFAIPYFAKSKIERFALDKLNSSLYINSLSFNPFTFSSTATALKLTDKDATLWFSADEIDINLNLWNSIFNNISIEKFSIRNPYYKIVTQNQNNKVSIKYPKIKPPKKVQTSPEKFILDVNNISISKGSIHYNDESGKKQFNLNLKELNFNQQLFTTKDNDSHFELSVKTQNNDETYLSGLFNFAQLKLDAKWQLTNWATATIFTFIGNKNKQFFGFDNSSGQVNADGAIFYQSTGNEKSQVTINQFELADFQNRYEDNQSFAIAKTLLIDGKIDLINHTMTLAEVKTDGALLELTFDENNTLIWSELPTSNNNELKDSKTQKQWSFDVQKFSNTKSLLVINKMMDDSSFKNTIKLQTVEVNNISSNTSNPITVNADVVLDETGRLNLQSQILLENLNINSTVDAKQIDLSKFSAWVPANIKLSLNKGYLSFQQDINFNETLISTGDIQVRDLELLDHNKTVFLQLKQLNLEQFLLNSAQKSIKLNNIKLDEAQGMLVLSADKQLNLTELVDKSKSKTTQDNNAGDWKVEIKQIELIDAKTSFVDRSIKPQYHTELSKLNGHIKGLSSSNLAKAKVKLSGVIDSYGKITIDGEINPISDKAYTDLAIVINNLDLQNFNSYSSRYLGFPINRGKADFNLKYKLNQSILKGINNLTFKQLKFGNKTASKQALNLPLKLAVTLLTDGKGVMKINMPVSGNIDDPEFSYGSLVFKAFFKLVTSIVASPFKLLGKLVPGGADLDLSGVQFQAGSSKLKINEQEKLKAMQQILSKKPDLNLELTAITNTQNDSKALGLIKLLQQAKLKAIPDFADESSIVIIEKLYKNQELEKSWGLLRNESTANGIVKTNTLLEKAWKELLSSQNIESELAQLAKQRTLFIQNQLIEKYTIAEDKIFLKQAQKSQELPPQVKFGIAQ